MSESSDLKNHKTKCLLSNNVNLFYKPNGQQKATKRRERKKYIIFCSLTMRSDLIVTVRKGKRSSWMCI